mmetsp:Transcript_36085/g.57482  ORF Transcript_36085/g.57482 Transcript_36085/m.57482 type:complete len:83 (-) Transcript_36085:161-409(-)
MEDAESNSSMLSDIARTNAVEGQQCAHHVTKWSEKESSRHLVGVAYDGPSMEMKRHERCARRETSNSSLDYLANQTARSKKQ